MINPDGTVVSSSQQAVADFDIDQRSAIPMLGTVISVQPSDSKGNLTASVESDQRGYRHEATVLITSAGDYEPYLLLENVVIPPRNRSNYDDYDEDLPVGVSAALDGSVVTENWAQIDPALMDGDCCVVNFIGGNLDKPFIQNWWPHPKNKIDPATSGQACLTQFDPMKKRSRRFRRSNGVTQVTTKDGDTYFDTSQAGSRMDMSGKKPLRKEIAKGGSVQVNVKTGQQMELNWNPTVEGLKAGSNSQSQSRENDLPHLSHDKAVGTTPAARSISDTILRFKKQEGTISTGKMVLRCHKDGGGAGFFMATGDEGVVIGQGASGEVLASLSISDGKVLLSTPEGDNLSLSSNQIVATTTGGASVQLDGSSAVINAAGGISLNGGLLPSPVALANELATELTAMIAALGTYTAAVGSSIEIISEATGKNTSVPIFTTEQKTTMKAANAAAAAAASLAANLLVGIGTPGATLYTSKLVGAK